MGRADNFFDGVGMMIRVGLRIGAGAVLLAAVASAPISASAQDLQTGPERSGFTEYTSYDDMMTYLTELQATSAEMKLGYYGETWEERKLPYAVFSRPAITQPREAHLSGKPVLVLAAGVHGGERTLRESVLIMMRELATAGTEANGYLDDVVLVIVPQVNPDGFSATPNGQRGNSWGIDLNRDYIKLEQPSIANYVQNVIHYWNPHLYIDGHNGGAFPYNLNYQCPSHASPDQRITLLCDEEIFPAIDARLEADGYQSFFYQRGNETRWNGGGDQARIGRNYGGFVNTVGILFESPPSQDMSDGVPAGMLGYKAVVEWSIANPERLIETVERARRETIEMGLRAEGEVVVDMEYAPEDYQVTYQLGVQGEDGEVEVITVVSDSLMKKPVATKTRPRPYAYILPRDARDAVALLRKHDITVEVLQVATEIEVDAYVLEGVSYSRQYNHAGATIVELADDPETVTMTFPKGSYIVPTGQVFGRLVAHMLEPETDDNVIYWNTMDAWLPTSRLGQPEGQQGGGFGAGFGGGPQGPPLVPIYKLMSARPLQSEIMPNNR